VESDLSARRINVLAGTLSLQRLSRWQKWVNLCKKVVNEYTLDRAYIDEEVGQPSPWFVTSSLEAANKGLFLLKFSSKFGLGTRQACFRNVKTKTKIRKQYNLQIKLKLD